MAVRGSTALLVVVVFLVVVFLVVVFLVELRFFSVVLVVELTFFEAVASSLAILSVSENITFISSYQTVDFFSV